LFLISDFFICCLVFVICYLVFSFHLLFDFLQFLFLTCILSFVV